ncbi:MAG: GAF domain-containing protein, partial [Burkholderiales bacterium]|nr:GAF domain-containing protein [Burkholderiales bacterium]
MWLLAWVAHDQGQLNLSKHFLTSIANSDVEPNRRCIAKAAHARMDAFQNVAEARPRWQSHFAEDNQRSLAANCWVEDYLGLLEAIEGNESEGIRHNYRGFTMAVASGQMRRAIILAINLGDWFANLHEYHTALEWRQRGLQMARQSGWRLVIGTALQHCGHTFVKLGKLDIASDMLNEAQFQLEIAKDSRANANVYKSLANLYSAQLNFDKALDSLQKLEAVARTLQQSDLISLALIGKAIVFSELGLARAAEQAGLAALTQAKSTTHETIPALLALASIHKRHASQLPMPTSAQAEMATWSVQPETTPPSATLYYLHRALHLANEVENYIVPPELFDELAEEYARLNDGLQAYQYAKQAAQSRSKIYSNDADDRAQALQLSYKLEQDALALENNKRLAAEQTQRAALLEQANETLQDLGSIGQQITQHLDAKKVYAVITDYLEQLLQADTILIYLLRQDHIESVHHMEQGQRLPNLTIALADPYSNTARCLREDTEIVLEFPRQTRPSIPGTAPKRSALFAPLKIADKVLGVMTIQSTYRERYDTRAQMIFRTLCAYTAIALSNCQTHTALAQAHLDLDIAHRHLQDT